MADHKPDTSGGVELTDEVLDELADEAERGYDPEELRTRPGRGRPPLGTAAATVFHVRLPPALRDALDRAATDDQVTPSEVVRRALRSYLDTRSPRGDRRAS